MRSHWNWISPTSQEKISVHVARLTRPAQAYEDRRRTHDLDGHPVLGHHRNAVPCFRCRFCGVGPHLGPLNVGGIPLLGLFWTPYADWIYTVLSLSGLLLICWLVLVRSGR